MHICTQCGTTTLIAVACWRKSRRCFSDITAPPPKAIGVDPVMPRGVPCEKNEIPNRQPDEHRAQPLRPLKRAFRLQWRPCSCSFLVIRNKKIPACKACKSTCHVIVFYSMTNGIDSSWPSDNKLIESQARQLLKL